MRRPPRSLAVTTATPARRTSEVSAFFDLRAPHYDRAYDGQGPDAYLLHERMRAVLGMLPAPPGEALDVGMGPGRLCEQLEARGWTVSGVDPSEEMVSLARGRCPAAAERLHVGRAEALEQDDASFDVVVGTGVLEYAADVERLLAEMARVLRPGGVAVVSLPNPRAVYARWKCAAVYPLARAAGRAGLRARPLRPSGGRSMDLPELEQLLRAAGIEVRTVEPVGHFALHTPLDAVLPRTTVRLARRLAGSGPRVSRALATQMVFSARRVP